MQKKYLWLKSPQAEMTQVASLEAISWILCIPSLSHKDSFIYIWTSVPTNSYKQKYKIGVFLP